MAGADEGEYPHQIKFESDGSCGATIYNKNWLITAAHCVSSGGEVSATVENTRLVVGKANVKGVPDSEKLRVDKIIVHEAWDMNDKQATMKGNDIALLHLSKPLNYEIGRIQPLRIVDADYVYPYGGQGITIGWGKAGKLGSVEHLKEFQVPIHHPVKAGQLSFDNVNASPSRGGMLLNDQLLGVAGGDSGYSKNFLWLIFCKLYVY